MSMTYGSVPPNNSLDESSANLSGMTKTIYESIKPFVDTAISQINAIPGADDSVKNPMKMNTIYYHKFLSYAIAEGVIKHILSNMEVTGIKAKIDSPSVSPDTTNMIPWPGGIPGPPVPTPGNGTAQVSNPQVSQTNGGTGLVK